MPGDWPSLNSVGSVWHLRRWMVLGFNGLLIPGSWFAIFLRFINVGVAISLRQGGLIAPALLGTDNQNLDELMKNFRDLVKRARGGSLRSSELSEPTITITSLGERGAESVFGIIYPPQVAIVGFGRPIECPKTVEGRIISRPAITATLSADHRVSGPPR